MDPNNRWEITALAYDAAVDTDAECNFNTAGECFAHVYAHAITDNGIPPCTSGDYKGVAASNGLIKATCNTDRIKQIGGVLVNPDVVAKRGCHRQLNSGCKLRDG